ncbi:thioesterase domain-containing protein [Aspergillus puulaauensis]|uniref:Putative secondary metabolism biosynthetic enzyme n=1 Tax=Aspergillus puulaauensis TaxID=1220207 RepID=A0A7R8ANH2_9EURO|nr:putative secondary metabolism biosynthetic enzyme [Aspergillus puulaauensis]BCS24867.1 putative secondary metabolism biosynthetic enzyme [Aspergillus puulaauensis]
MAETVAHIQGNPSSPLTPLILVHAISGLALPYFALGSLSADIHDHSKDSRPVYGLSSPIYESVPAFRRHSKSLPSLALEYVRIIRRDIQPNGPYLLGGWSMGGMIAVEMAAILAAQGESVKHVVLVDSLNPEVYLPFHDAQERRVLATLTYNAIAWRVNGPMDTPGFEGSAGAPSSSREGSRATSSENSPENTDYGSDSEDGSQGDMDEFMDLIREHITQGLCMLASYQTLRRRVYLPETAVTLVKCTALGSLSPLLSEGRRAFAIKNNLDPSNGWRAGQFGSFVSVPFAATHDACFDAGVAAKLTTVLRDVLKDIE